jgi:hypothetical protein
MAMHAEKNTFICKWEGCPYGFKTKGSLKRHMRRHTGERPYKCDKCGMSFAESGALTRHWKSRTPCTNKSAADYPCYGRKKPLAAPSIEQVKAEEQEPEEIELEEGEIRPENTAPEESRKLEDETDEPIRVLPSDDIGENISYVIEQVVAAEESVPMETTSSTEIQEDSMLQPGSTCVICETRFEELSELQEHLITHLGDKLLKCCLCQDTVALPIQLVDHLLSEHPSEITVVADMAMVPLLVVEADSEQKASKKTQVDQALTDVNRALQQFLILTRQIEPTIAEGAVTLFQCGACSSFFKTNWQLKCHMRTNHEAKKTVYGCDICGKTFNLKDALTKHMSAHSDERNFKCGECGKTFKRISHVREHLKVHSSERPYPCPMCGKAFKTSNAAKVHLRTHNNFMPYQCTVCRKTFREKSSLERHHRTHTGERPFACKRCGCRFAEHGTLNRHMRAKVPCTQKTAETKQETPSLLAEFSSMVADTQQYIVQPSADKDQYVALVEGDIPTDNNVIMVQEGVSDNISESVHYVHEGDLESEPVQYFLVAGDEGEVKMIPPEEQSTTEGDE